jgi:hypothetical protein
MQAVLSQSLSYPTTEFDSTEADLFTRSGSVADPIVKDLLTAPGKPPSIKVRKLVRLTRQAPPLKREDGAGRPPWTTARPRPGLRLILDNSFSPTFSTVP